ncbi:putative alpha/beta hydrolase family protein [Pseudomassariella vexata]|uniref:Putative alpha/beta hydrolase family protein n=1 Tax=Pseudomassariella vexata TaxID=1141098 RepID=A0A1Y2E4W8_9PEZI|nr:putative alpha/beta hydrolase family protein [Pseudomassariella vexata]ORY66404.1 putative alpha/beta hydrolase family protein [Pseudomassariella vexata]
MDFITRLLGGVTNSSTSTVVATTFAATVVLLWSARYTLYPVRDQVLPGPLTTSIPHLSKEEVAKLPYTPDHFPGARDVATPYGNIRVYEFGPEDGRKVLFLHGISTSCLTLTDIALDMVHKKGCRVMLFDLFGRGFTDGVGDLPFDTRLFVSQMLLVLASSHLPWTGENACHVVGYSLGGGIAVNFAATFPHLVASLVLLAPAGVIRPANIGYASRLVFTSGIIPERLLAALTKRRLRTPIGNAVHNKKKIQQSTSVSMSVPTTVEDLTQPLDGKETFTDAAVQEAVDPDVEGKEDDDTVNSLHPLEAKIAAYIHWMLDAHAGFVPAFMSTIRFAPLMGQHEHWRQLADRKPWTTAIILGRRDELIQRDDYEEDALPLVGGKEKVFWRVVPGGHNFPFTHSKDALQAIYEFWAI